MLFTGIKITNINKMVLSLNSLGKCNISLQNLYYKTMKIRTDCNYDHIISFKLLMYWPF